MDHGQKEKSSDTADKSQCETLKAAADLIFDYQRARLEAAYSDIEGIEDVKSFFFDKIYPAPEARAKLAPRNRSIRRIVSSWLFRVALHHYTVEAAQRVLELEQITESINRRLAAALFDHGLPDGPVGEDLYFTLSRGVSNIGQRRRQLENALYGLDYCKMVVVSFPKLKDAMRFVPIPMRRHGNLITFGVEGYRILSAHKDRIDEYLAVIREREHDYINRMFGVPVGAPEAGAKYKLPGERTI